MCYTEELRKFFDNQGITQKAIAQRMNVDPAYINKLLNGKKGLWKEYGEAVSRPLWSIFYMAPDWRGSYADL